MRSNGDLELICFVIISKEVEWILSIFEICFLQQLVYWLKIYINDAEEEKFEGYILI